MKNIFLTLLVLVMMSCSQKSDSNKENANSLGNQGEKIDPCFAIVENLIAKFKNDFSDENGIGIDLNKLGKEELECLPENDGIISSVETGLKYAEAVDGFPDLQVVIAYVETYLKYGEAMGATGGGDPYTDPRLVYSSIETYLKYAEAFNAGMGGMTIPSSRIILASVETYLKGAEAGGAPSATSVVANIENYLKYAEAVGAAEDPDRKICSDNTEYSNTICTQANFAKEVAGYWSSNLNAKGLVLDGDYFWKNTKHVADYFGISTSKITNISLENSIIEILEKGIATNLNQENSLIAQSLLLEKSFSSLLNILDKGVVIDPDLMNISESVMAKNQNDILRILDKGIIIDSQYQEAALPFLKALNGDEFSIFDLAFDKGIIASEKSQYFMHAFIKNELVDAERFLDYGYVIVKKEESILLIPVENYLKYAEAVGSSQPEA
jgi:hypothetical protein